MIDFAVVQELASRLTRVSDDAQAFCLLEQASLEHFNHILFTVLRFDFERKEMRRLFSNREDVSPTGGAKPLPESAWADTVISNGECYIGYSKEDLKEVFFDHRELWAIGCESVMNVPVVWMNRTVGSINIMGRAAQYDPSDAAAMSVFGQLAVPLLASLRPRHTAVPDAQQKMLHPAEDGAFTADDSTRKTH